MAHYDYIILGAGAAGLLLADALGRDPQFAHQSILLLDKAAKTQNDRTWCFWEKGNGPLDPLVHKSWTQMYVAGKTIKRSATIAPYTYKMIRGIDFYTHYLKRIKTYPNITWVQDTVTHFEETPDEVRVVASKNTYFGKKVFNSLLNPTAMVQQNTYPVLQQHFLGWFVNTEKAAFNPEVVTFMDFSIPQQGNTRFVYVLPFSEREALVEYTLFSEHLLAQSEYEAGLKAYLAEHYSHTSYTITDTEVGSIPMTCYPFHQNNTARMFHIGIAGGWAKPSTGFTFYNTYQQVQALVKQLKQQKPLSQLQVKDKFWWYDLLLLDVLSENNSLGSTIFESLFSRRKLPLILKFLAHNTHFGEDLMIFYAPHPLPFIKAILKRSNLMIKVKKHFSLITKRLKV